MPFLCFPWPAAGQLEQALSKCPERALVQFTLHIAARARVCACGLCSSEHRCRLCAWASRWEGPSSRLALPWALPQAPASRTAISWQLFSCSVPAPPWPTLSLWPGKPALLSSYSSFTTYSDAPPSGAFCSGPTGPTEALCPPQGPLWCGPLHLLNSESEWQWTPCVPCGGVAPMAGPCCRCPASLEGRPRTSSSDFPTCGRPGLK